MVKCNFGETTSFGPKACYFAIKEMFAILIFSFLPDNVTSFILIKKGCKGTYNLNAMQYLIGFNLVEYLNTIENYKFNSAHWF